MIDVCWPSYHARTSRYGSWDMAFLEDILGGEEYVEYAHHETFESAKDAEGIVLVIPGQHHAGDIDRLNEDVAKYKWVLLCLLGDEESLFDIGAFKHPNSSVWIQSRATSLADRPRFHLPWGYTHETRKYANPDAEKKTNWFFSGQVTHIRRQQCVNVLRRMPNGLLNQTVGFTQGFDRPEYYRLMGESKIVVCPAGVVTPDSFRIWEALESRCVPIVDGMSPRPEKCGTAHWWETILGTDPPPFPVIYDWNDLPRVMDEQLRQWPANELQINMWWINYKERMRNMMAADIGRLRSAA